MQNWPTGRINVRQSGQWLFIIILTFFWIRTIVDKNFLFDFEACCPFGGIQAIATFFNSGALACTMGGMQVVMGVMLVLSVILVSKLFCSHVCPVGTLSEGLGRIGKRLKIKKIELKGFADYATRALKYMLLFVVFYLTLKSNDLFCKKFDPFFAAVTLFGQDVSTWMAGSAIGLLVGGGIFFRQFWCRYLCPLGAISTAFKYFYVFLVFAAIAVILSLTGVNIDLVYVLIALTLVAYSLEIIGMRRNAGMQLLRITRSEEVCVDCGLCDKKCPQGIRVSSMKVVDHPDCNLCTECIGNCPDEEAITINGREQFRWLPVLITVALIMTGLIFGANLSIPTVDMKWGEDEQVQRSAMFEMSGLKHVKCYGSSMTFVDQMKQVPGITGAATFVKDHRVQVFYDTTMLSEPQVRRSLFTPKFMDIHIPGDDDEVHVLDLYIENFFDQLDVVFLANLVEGVEGVYSFQTIYGDPVKVRIYADASVEPDSIARLIEQSDLVYATAEERFSSEGLYTVDKIAKSDTVFSGRYLKSLSFPSFSRAFNGRNQYTNEQLGQVIFRIDSYPRNTQMMPYLINHLGKADPYIVGLIARYTGDGPVAVVFYVKGKTSEEHIRELIMMDELTITYDNGVREQVENPYTFKTEP